jgi:hypothetical protein
VAAAAARHGARDKATALTIQLGQRSFSSENRIQLPAPLPERLTSYSHNSLKGGARSQAISVE